MPIKHLYFIRHGQSLANTGGASMPDAEIPLTDIGRQQAVALQQTWPLRPQKIYCSSLLRARQTAAVFGDAHQQGVETLSLLDEFRYLGFERVHGLQGAERAPLAKHYWTHAAPDYRDAPDADSFMDFQNRVDRFINTIEHYPDNTFFFGHGIWIALLCWRLLGAKTSDNQAMQQFRQFQTSLPMHNTAVYRLRTTDGLQQIEIFQP